MIDFFLKNWFRFIDVVKYNKVLNFSCKKSGRRVMVGNLEIIVKMENMVGIWLWLVYYIKGYVI